MDESLKARLIGATVLVAVAVILIPELLTGRGPARTSTPVPGDRGTRTIVIDVPVSGATVSAPTPTPTPAPTTVVGERGPGAIVQAQQSGQPAATPETTRPGPAPTPVTTPAAAPAATVVDNRPGPVASGAAPGPAPAASRPTAAPAATQASSPQAAAARGAWAVQVGAFGSTGAAAKVVNELSSAGFRAYVSPVQRGGKTLYRVRVGPEAERSRADALAASLKGRGLPATVVAND